MVGRIHRSVQQALDGTPEVARAAGDLHHLNIGPGEALTAEWVAAGLELPDLPAMRQYRVNRIVAQLNELGYDGIVLFDPLNVRYATDSTNMQLWVMHNGARYAFVGADGHVCSSALLRLSSRPTLSGGARCVRQPHDLLARALREERGSSSLHISVTL